MKHWRIEDVSWDRFDPSRVDPSIVPLVKAAAMVERNGTDYALYLNHVFVDDPDFRQAADNWSVEEVQHGDALGRWASLADPSWDYQAAFARYKAGYKVPVEVDTSVRGSRTGELIARCMVETGTSSYYSALGDATEEPVLKEICRLIAADEFRHFKLFYDHMHRYLEREKIGVFTRLRIATGRVAESEDDELAYAFHCSNEPEGVAYEHGRCIAAYMSRAMSCYRYRHLARGVAMILKAVGLPPQGRVSGVATWLSWQLMQRRRRKFARELETLPRAA
ncbi:MAG TPA: ferritin-like domain-containing protein [Acetobacteraceae bacterium]|nr:ferritin-like domain-containing protein [Acetobacteraceae bacterium]